jgi:anti-sigma B factor antagonist
VDVWSHAVGRDGTTRIVILSGEIDMSVHEAVLAVFLSQINEPETTIVRVDLTAVTFLDSSGLHALVTARQAAGQLGRRFTVTGAKGPVLQVLDLTGLSSLLAEHPTDTP